jgi:hypothetical protein
MLSIGVSVGLAKSGPTQIKADLRSDWVCPPTSSKSKVVGSAQITNEKGAWKIVVHMRGAPSGLYHLDVYDGSCTPLTTSIGWFKVGADGSGDNAIGGPATGGPTAVYVTVHNNDLDFVAGTDLLQLGGG